SIADKVAFIENGRDVETTSAADLEQNPEKLTRYLGV
ncbi:ABC transporter ATP-binding protein, partial [Sulfitobacter mediterraneus]|nr:ABC transporter ATP-binding protein [Sulfitobacter mediterraneus]